MIKLSKSPLPQNINITSRNDYRKGTPAHDILLKDFHGKCYICEDNSENLTIEHFKPKSKPENEEHDWNNLFLACEHCNLIKADKFENIINPIETDPEKKIYFQGISEGKTSIGKVLLAPISSDKETEETIELLDAVFNRQRLKAAKLRTKLHSELRNFRLYIQHKNEDGYLELIQKETNNSSPFAAFKRAMWANENK